MKYGELKSKLDELKLKNDKAYMQTHIMFIPLNNKVIKQTGDKEVQVQYEIENVINEFLYKENKTIFLIGKFLICYLKILNTTSKLFLEKNICFPPDSRYQELTYYFDSFISSFSVIIEPEQKELLKQYFNKDIIDKKYPSKQNIGIYWQINMLRNRILHFTSRRYDYTNKACYCYENFSSEIKMINIDQEGNISIPSTLIDIYSDKKIEMAINKSISDGSNVFDNLFPNKTPKGYSKKKPFICHISNDIFFDYTNSLINLLSEIENFFDDINSIFIKKLSTYYDDMNDLKNSKTSILLEGKEILYSVNDIFDI